MLTINPLVYILLNIFLCVDFDPNDIIEQF